MKEQNLIVELKQRNSQEYVGSTADADELLKELKAKQQQLADLQSSLTIKTNEITKLEKDISDLQAKVLDKVDKSIYDNLQAKYDRDINLPRDLAQFKTEISETVSTSLATNTAKIQELQETIEANSLVISLNQQLVEANGRITQLNSQNTSLHTESSQVKMQNQNLQTQITVLQRELQEAQDQNSQINRGWLPLQYANVTIDQFYEMYRNSQAMRELGIVIPYQEYNLINAQFLNKLPLLKASSDSDIITCFTRLGNSINLKSKTYVIGTATNAKYSLFGEYYVNINENSTPAVYINYDNYKEADPYPVFKQYVLDNGWDIVEFRFDISTYGKKFLFFNNVVGNYFNRNNKVKLTVRFELSDGSFTAPQPISITQKGEWVDMGATQRPVSNKFINSNLCYWWGEVPDNAVAFRYVLNFSEAFASNMYADKNSLMFSSPEIRGI